LEKNAITIVLHIPFAVIDRVTIGSGTAIKPGLVAQRFKPRLQWITRPLASWIADENNGSDK
jgi:hypothetical protein